MHNLLGAVRVETQAGTVDRQTMQRVAPAVRDVFTGLMERLDAILRETGSLESRLGELRQDSGPRGA